MKQIWRVTFRADNGNTVLRVDTACDTGWDAIQRARLTFPSLAAFTASATFLWAD